MLVYIINVKYFIENENFKVLCKRFYIVYLGEVCEIVFLTSIFRSFLNILRIIKILVWNLM